jgi:hypothetical protein
VEDNVFENNWADGQSGFALVMKSVNQSGGCNWCVAQDLTFRWNVLKNSPGGFNIAAQQNESGGTSIPLNGLVIEQFLFDSVGQSSQTGSRFLFQLLQNLDSVSITHTTGLIQAGSITSLAGGVMSHFRMSQNLWANGQYGIKGDSKAPGTGTISYYMPTGIFSDNVIIGAPANDYPAGNLYPASLSLVPGGVTVGVDTVALATRLKGVAP